MRRQQAGRRVVCLLPPLRGSSQELPFEPWADAHGYSLPSLCDCAGQHL